jgi:hypothetical protein
VGRTTVEHLPSEFAEFSDESLGEVLGRAEIDLRLSRNDPDRFRRINAIFQAALAERERRFAARFAKPS